jgi:hypothetical protein
VNLHAFSFAKSPKKQLLAKRVVTSYRFSPMIGAGWKRLAESTRWEKKMNRSYSKSKSLYKTDFVALIALSTLVPAWQDPTAS